MSVAASAVLALVAGAGGLILAGVLAEAQRPSPDRSEAPGTFRRLAAGETHVVWQGPEVGPLLVLVHGLSTPSEVWTGVAERLAGAGIRTLRYDLYGRGYSDRPARVHDARLYVRQLSGVLEAEGIEGPVALAGYSMGGAIVTHFARAYPERVHGLALLAPAGLTEGLGGLYAFAARVPVIGDALWSLRAGPMLAAAAQREAQSWPAMTVIMAREAASRGYAPALLSSLRNLLGRPLDGTHRWLAARGVPVLALWGAQDTVIPVAARQRLGAAHPQAEQHVLEGAGHSLACSHADDVADYLTHWLGRLNTAGRDGAAP